MKKLIFISILILSKYSFSQAPEIEWQNDIGGSQEDRVRSIEPTSDGGYIVAGFSLSYISGDKTENCLGSYDLWVIKLDSLGNIEWQNTIGGNSQESNSGVVVKQTNDGGYIVGTHSGSDISADKSEPFLGMHVFWGDYWVLKLDSIGNIEWQNTIGGSGDDVLTALQITPDGGYVIGGWSDSPISYDKTEPSFGIFDYWIVKLNNTGNIEWQKTIGGDQNDYLADLQLTSDGGFIATGYSESHASGNKSEETIGSADYWIVKLDSLGNIIWENTIGSTNGDYAAGSIQTSDNGYITGGFSFSGVGEDKTEPQIGFADYWIVKTDSSGNVVWDKTIGGGDYDYMYCLSQTKNNGYMIGGSSNSGASGVKTEPSMGSYDMWVVRLDSAGNILWDNTIGGYGEDGLYSMRQSDDSTFILAGYSNSIASGDKDESYIGGFANYDYWIVKLFRECNFETYYKDADGDGYGDNSITTSLCDIIPPTGYVIDNTDCNDSIAEIKPGASEICNDLDDNCNFVIDEGLPLNTYYFDADADGYGTILFTIEMCSDIPPEGYVIDNTDCDDAIFFIHEPVLYFGDEDGDLYGDILNSEYFCTFITPTGYATNSLDCDDSNILINPVTNEICNNIDDNCNTSIDEGLPTQTLFIDNDDDNFGNLLIDTITCFFEIAGYVSDNMDCDDTNPLVYPDAPEILDGVDNDCNQIIDEGVGINGMEGENGISIYPNPANDKIILTINTQFNINSSSNISICDLSGKIISHLSIKANKTEIDLSKYTAGIYFVRVIVKDNQYVQKLIME